jgi:TPR repeat protein
MKRLRLAAETGDAGSQFNLGVFYDNSLDDNGHAVGGNRTEAMKWLLRAARQGLPRAQTRLAELYADGSEAAGDHVRAGAWFLRAAAGSSGADRAKAQSGYERISSHMAPTEIAKARRLARAWTPRQPDAGASAARVPMA